MSNDKMRDRIAKVIAKKRHSENCQDEWWVDDCDEHMASAVVAALPDMVAPLVWKDTSKNDGWEVHQTGTAPNGTYYVIKAARYSDMLLCIQCGYFSDLSAAKAAANAHHRAAIMAAFGADL